MGILRSDRVSGLGGANAITGSVFFGRGGTSAVASGNWLTAYSESDFSFGTGDFTIEYWFYFTGVSGSNSGCFQISNTVGGINNSNTAADGGLALDYENGCVKGIGNNGWFNGTNSVAVETWNHVALVRHSGTLQIFTNGVADTSASDSQNYSLTHLAIGGYYTNAYLMTGYISNFRIVKGTAVYSAAFTPPTERLTAIDGTVLLACQSPGNILQEETGKTLDIRKVNSNDAPPQASRFVPDKGENYGTTFEDNTRFNTLSYMVPPAGKTTQRNRGRGILFGGGSPGRTDRIDYIDIPSGGNSIDFGSLAAGSVFGSGAGASSTRGVFWAGENQYTKLDFVTIATTGNATSFGTSSNSNNGGTCMSSETRAVYTLGQAGNVMEYVTIASTGNTIDFGDQGIDDNLGKPAGLASPTRGIVSGGYGPSPYPQSNTIEYITIATTGNGQDFGDLTFGHSGHFGVSSTTRGVFAKGYTFPSPATTYYNTIEFITIASTGNATDFGDATNSVTQGYSHASHTRGVFAAGTAASDINTIDYVTIATTGNALDFGDTYSPCRGGSGTSDCHGGIS